MGKMQGIITVTITPFNKDGSIDYESAAKHIDWQISSGVHGLLPLGATGEFSALSIAERKEYAEFFIKKVAGRVPVMIGIVSMNLKETLELAEHAASIGATAVMALPSPGLHLSQAEIYEFYRTLSEKVSLPVMVYNNPGSCGVDIAPETMQRIATLPQMEYLKESTGDIKRLTMAVDHLSKDMTVLCGCENLAYESLMMGAKGWLCVAGNVAPTMCVTLYQLITVKKDLEAARDIYRKLLPLLSLIEDTGELWQVVKYTAAKQGIIQPYVRAPRCPISASSKEALDSLLQKYSYQ